MAIHAVVRTDKMFGTDNRAGLVSVRYQPSDVMTAIDNGNVVLLGNLEAGSREVYKGATPAANSPKANIVLIAAPEVEYDERKRNLEDYENEAGKIVRGYRLHTGDNFAVTAEALSAAATPAVGNIVELEASTKLKVVASATSASTQIGKVVAIEKAGRRTYIVIEVA